MLEAARRPTARRSSGSSWSTRHCSARRASTGSGSSPVASTTSTSKPADAWWRARRSRRRRGSCRGRGRRHHRARRGGLRALRPTAGRSGGPSPRRPRDRARAVRLPLRRGPRAAAEHLGRPVSRSSRRSTVPGPLPRSVPAVPGRCGRVDPRGPGRSPADRWAPDGCVPAGRTSGPRPPEGVPRPRGSLRRRRDRPDLDTARPACRRTCSSGPPAPPSALLHHPRPLEGATACCAASCAWREFYADVLFHQPGTVWPSRCSRARRPPRRRRPPGSARFAAWAEGRTGYPIVDAGMRQLQAEGWMPNRVRMVAASFLVKDLHLPWQRGRARSFAATSSTATWPPTTTAGSGWPAPAPTPRPTTASSTPSPRAGATTPMAPTSAAGSPSGRRPRTRRPRALDLPPRPSQRLPRADRRPRGRAARGPQEARRGTAGGPTGAFSDRLVSPRPRETARR